VDDASYGRVRLVAGRPLPSSSISFGMRLVMAIACGVAAANIYYNQPMLGIMEAAFSGQVTVIGLVPTATQLGFAAGLLLLVPLGDRFDRRRLILIQLAALTLSLAAAALAPEAWSLVVASALVGGTASVAQQIVPFAAELRSGSYPASSIGKSDGERCPDSQSGEASRNAAGRLAGSRPDCIPRLTDATSARSELLHYRRSSSLRSMRPTWAGRPLPPPC
jgi:Major Facilitator Superfamily